MTYFTSHLHFKPDFASFLLLSVAIFLENKLRKSFRFALRAEPTAGLPDHWLRATALESKGKESFNPQNPLQFQRLMNYGGRSLRRKTYIDQRQLPDPLGTPHTAKRGVYRLG